MSGWATSVINADTLGITLGDGANVALLGFGDDLTLTAIVESGIDSAITAGLSSVVYGTDFGAGFLSSFSSSVVSLATADFQTLIGDQGLNEGGFAHAGLHGVVGCLGAVATGADCAAGALGGVVGSIYAGTLEGKGPDPTNYATKEDYDAAYGAWRDKVATAANLIGGVVGYVFSGGSAANVSATASIAQSGVLNNYLSHGEALEREIAKRELAACLESGECSDEQIAELTSTIEILDFVDADRDSFLRESCQNDPRGANCIAAVRELAFTLELFKDPQDPFGIGSTVDQIVLTYINAQILANSGVFQTGSDGALTLTGMVSEWDQGMALLGTYSESWGVVQDERFTENALNLLAATMNILELGGVAFAGRTRGSGFEAAPINPTRLNSTGKAYYLQLRKQNVSAIDAYYAATGRISELPYAARIRIRAVQDPVGHNFPRSIDDIIYEVPPVVVGGGGLGYAVRGYVNGKPYIYNVIVRNGRVVHRDVIPEINWQQRSRSFNWPVELLDIPTGTVN